MEKRRRKKILEILKKSNQIYEVDYFILEKNKSLLITEKAKLSQLSSQTIQTILKDLSSFEIKQDFLNNNITLVYLALKLKTNSKYLSKTINLHKKKSFSQYINDLRIEYLIEKLKTDKTFTNYTIKAIGKEIGFNTSNAFSKAFFKKAGMHPSQYIKELNR